MKIKLRKQSSTVRTSANDLFIVGFEVFTAVVMKSTIFWDLFIIFGEEGEISSVQKSHGLCLKPALTLDSCLALFSDPED
jgi:hypothetical protein